MCSTCVDIKRELSTIIVRRSKGMSVEKKEHNANKLRQKQELLVELDSHDCMDRRSGKRDVPADYSWILRDILRIFSSRAVQQDRPDEKKQQVVPVLPVNLAEGFSDSDSDSEGYIESTDGLGLLRSGQAKPVAYRRRGERITKGMFIATLADPTEQFMGSHPFWIQKVLRVTKRRVKVHYYGPEFLGVYQPLTDVDNGGIPSVDYFRRGDFTTVHWNISFVGKYRTHDGGRLSANDQAYLKLDVRVPWDGSSSSSSSSSRSSRSSNTSKKRARQGGASAGKPPTKRPKKRS